MYKDHEVSAIIDESSLLVSRGAPKTANTHYQRAYDVNPKDRDHYTVTTGN